METLEMRMTTDLEASLPAEIGFNFDELEVELAARLEHYNHLIVTEDSIQEGKADLANLRKLREAIETRRKEVKKQWNQPIIDFEAKVKKLVTLIDAPVKVIDSQIKNFEEQEREQKRGKIAAVYEEIVPGNLTEIIPLCRIQDPRWLNKNTTMKSIREAITQIAKRANVDMALIDGVNPKYMAAVRTKYIETLDITTALNYQDELMEAEARFKQQEEARAKRAAQEAARAGHVPQAEEKQTVSAQEPVRESAPAPAPQPGTEERRYLLRLEFPTITRGQADALKAFLKANNIDYVNITNK